MAPSGLAAAQATREHHWCGYVFIAPGIATDGEGVAPTLHAGVGADRFVYRGLGIGGEIGYAGAMFAPSAGVGVASVNSSYYFRRANKLTPFVTGGYSLPKFSTVDLISIPEQIARRRVFREDLDDRFVVSYRRTYTAAHRSGHRQRLNDARRV
jgi:hypothetical protein